MNVNKMIKTFIALLVFIPFIPAYFTITNLDYSQTNIFFALIFIVLFYFLAVTITYLAIVAIAITFTKPKLLKERDTFGSPRTAVIYCVKHEGETLRKSIEATYEGNSYEDQDCDIFVLSNSSEVSFINWETQLVKELNEKYNTNSFKYYQARPPKHKGLEQLVKNTTDYKYFLIADADTYYPKGTIKALVNKAQSKENYKYGAFQSRIYTWNSETIYAKILSFGQEVAQRLYTTANWRILDNSVFYGSGALIRAEALRLVDVPDWVLSHDIWDTAILEKNGYKVAYCEDIITYEMFPVNFLEMVKREIRWAKGTIQSFQVSNLEGLSLSMLFNVLMPVYLYVMQAGFALWLILGMINQVFIRFGMPLLTFKSLVTVGILQTIIILILILHRFVIIRSFRDLRKLVAETIFSTLIYLNGVIFSTIGVISTFSDIQPLKWKPTDKDSKRLKILDAFRVLYPAFIVGSLMLAVFIWAGFFSFWSFFLFVIAFIFCIPLAVISSFKL